VLFALGVPACAREQPAGPQIDSLTPNRVLRGETTNAKISGRDFRTQLRVQVDSRSAPRLNRNFAVWLGSTALPNAAVTYENESTLWIVIPNTLGLGSYDLKVDTPTGLSATLRGALTVVEPASISSGGTVGNGSGGASSLSGGASSSGANSRANGGSTSTSIASNSGGVTDGLGGSTDGLGGGGASGDANAGGTTANDGGSSGTAVVVGGSPVTSSGGGSGGVAFSSGRAGSSGTNGAASAGGVAGQSALALAGASGSTTQHGTLWTQGRFLYDACGNQLTLRGVQQLIEDKIPSDNDWVGLMDRIAASGANAVRLQLNTTFVTITDVEAILARLKAKNIVAIVNPDAITWFGNSTVRSTLPKYRTHLMLDAYGPGYDDRTKFVSSAKSAITQIRGYGYQVPLIVLSNNYGRDLPAALNYGAEIVAADPLHNVVLGWDAYWGSSNWYQKLYGMTLSEGIAAAAAAPFPIQLGFILYTDPDELLDYETAMTAAQTNSLGWLWWDWYNPFDQTNNLSSDGTSTKLTSAGARVVTTHPGGLSHTTATACALP
jgi:mannan endo-1,4-beta-mannosidase